MTQSITKGKRGEREAAGLWIEAGFPEAARGIKQTRKGYEEPDVTGTPLWVEVKLRDLSSHNTIEHRKWYHKASTDMAKSHELGFIPTILEPIVMVKFNRRPWLVVAAENFMRDMNYVGKYDLAKTSGSHPCKLKLWRVPWEQFIESFTKFYKEQGGGYVCRSSNEAA